LAPAHAQIGLAKFFLGRGAESEGHINEAFRLSPRDIIASRWMVWVGLAKAQLGADAEAIIWMRRGWRRTGIIPSRISISQAYSRG
jgi:hypothetical protein